MDYDLEQMYHVAVPTVFDEAEELDVKATIQHIEYLQKEGIKAVLVCGSTGEQHSLSFAEKCLLLNAIEEANSLNNDLEILFGVASIRQKEAVKLAQLANKKVNIAGILVGFPPYIIPTQEEAVAYVTTIAAQYDKPIILYNNPKRTGFNLEFSSLLKLTELPNIIGLKEAGDEQRVPQLKAQIVKPFYFYAGGELNLSEKVHLGFNRLSSISGNLYPLAIKEWFNALLQGEKIDFHLENEIKQIFEGSPIAYLKKQITNKEGLCMGVPRKPLGNCSKPADD